MSAYISNFTRNVTGFVSRVFSIDASKDVFGKGLPADQLKGRAKVLFHNTLGTAISMSLLAVAAVASLHSGGAMNYFMTGYFAVVGMYGLKEIVIQNIARDKEKREFSKMINTESEVMQYTVRDFVKDVEGSAHVMLQGIHRAFFGREVPPDSIELQDLAK